MESKKTVKYIRFYKGLYIILSLKNSGGNKMRGIGLIPLQTFKPQYPETRHQKPVGDKSLDLECCVDTCFSQQNNSAIVIIFNRIGLHTVG